MVDEEERLLPIANVGRIMKQILPARAKVSKEAKQTMQESATEFISFVTGEASDKCRKENRKTVNGDDICWALGALGFDDYGDAIVRYLHKYRELERDKATENKASCSRTSRDKDDEEEEEEEEEEEDSLEDKSDHQPHQQTQAPTPSARV
ncbi:Nuclear transcription factor Y subunit B-5 [Hibiscus syriacus]|uniref:Nuclear transcription factor Y subunit B-5 n=1 Tax=Hibiscus syriacus TaxID=106335 RepID=A0A6A3AN31_HIBSY|nr:Nuclear transcription factor Y subunit B-5 [Hibiscus syriacus]